MEEKNDPEEIKLKSLIRGARIASIVAIVCYTVMVIPILVLCVPIIWNLTVWNMKREMRKNLQNSQ